MNTCVIYYSYEGNTKIIAETLAKEIDCDVFEIKPLKDMKSKGLMKYVWGGRQALMKETPSLEKFDFDLSNYDRVFLGTPIWSWTLAPAVRSLIQNDLRDKYVYLFYTHEGGDQGFYSKAEELVNHRNRLIGVRGFINVARNTEASISYCKEWSKEVKTIFRL